MRAHTCTSPYLYTEQTDRHRQRDRHTDRQTHKQTDTDRETDTQTDTGTDKTDKQTSRHTQTCRQTHTPAQQLQEWSPQKRQTGPPMAACWRRHRWSRGSAGYRRRESVLSAARVLALVLVLVPVWTLGWWEEGPEWGAWPGEEGRTETTVS